MDEQELKSFIKVLFIIGIIYTSLMFIGGLIILLNDFVF
jgi:hypothetical protein